MNKNAQKWVAALRSGEYKQTTDHLKDVNGFCCLGVACDLYEKETGEKLRDEDGYYGMNYEDQNLSGAYRVVKEWLGLRTYGGGMHDGSCLAEKNDAGATFEELADLIETKPSGLFVN